ncbi:hypothetical protein [Microbaculum sp. FT89]|uniref:hypothetical protein n=1 Tax=Microbaculum sp. FT89 TaxID=3447298 RepID=UPI003F52EB88
MTWREKAGSRFSSISEDARLSFFIFPGGAAFAAVPRDPGATPARHRDGEPLTPGPACAHIATHDGFTRNYHSLDHYLRLAHTLAAAVPYFLKA